MLTQTVYNEVHGLQFFKMLALWAIGQLREAMRSEVTLVSPWKACLCLLCCPGAAPDLATVSAHENCLPTLWRNPEGHL